MKNILLYKHCCPYFLLPGIPSHRFDREECPECKKPIDEMIILVPDHIMLLHDLFIDLQTNVATDYDMPEDYDGKYQRLATYCYQTVRAYVEECERRNND